MDRVIRRPLVWAALAALLGSWIGAGISFSPWMLLLPAVGVLGAVLSLGLAPGRGLSWAALFFCCGALALCAASHKATPPSLPQEDKTMLTGRVASVPRLREGHATLFLEDVALADGTSVQGRVWLYYRPNPDGDPAGIQLTEELLPAIGQRVMVEVRLRVPGGARNPGGFDFSRYLARQDAYLAAYAYDAWAIEGAPVPHPMTWMAKFRRVLIRHLDAQYGELSPYVRGMLLGDKEEIDGEGQRIIRGSGLSHLLAVSGLHVGFIALPLIWLLKRLRLGLLPRWLMLAALLGAYCLLVGAPAGTVRACAMTLILQGATVTGRRYDPLSALSAAFLLFLVPQPLALWDTGFVLSFSAMLGIFLLGERFRQWFARWPKGISAPVAVSLGAQLGCLPWTARYFGEVPMLGLGSNLLAVPLAGLVVQLGMVGLLLDFLWRPLAAPLVMSVSALMEAILGIARCTTALPFATLRVPAVGLVGIALYFLAMTLCYPRFLMRPALRWAGMGAAMAGAVVLVGLAVPRGIRYVQVDVGQGDAALLHAAGHTTVIDTGNTGSGGLADVLRYHGFVIDTLYISHPDADHAGALVDLLAEGMPIGRIVVPTDLSPEDFDPIVWQGFVRAQQQGIPILGMTAGETQALPGEVWVRALGPVPTLGGDTNDRSLVLMLEVEGIRILTTGDVGEGAEPLRGTVCDVLKVSHHGARTATGESFLRHAQPGIALISCGRNNSYGHPSPQVLGRLAEMGAQVYRTDRDGAVTLRLTDGDIAVSTYIKREEAP